MLPCVIIRVILTDFISENKTDKLTPAVYFFDQGIIETGKRSRRDGVTKRLKRNDHVKLAIEKLPCGKVHGSDLFMFVRGTFCLLRIIRIASALISANRFFDVDGGCIIFQDAPKEMLVVRAHFIFRSEEALCKAFFGITNCLVAGNVPVADKWCDLR